MILLTIQMDILLLLPHHSNLIWKEAFGLVLSLRDQMDCVQESLDKVLKMIHQILYRLKETSTALIDFGTHKTLTEVAKAQMISFKLLILQ